MIIDAVGTIFFGLLIFLLILLLIPIGIVLYLYFRLRGNSVTISKLWEGAKNAIIKIIKNFQKAPAKTPQPTKKNVEDAEFRELD